MLNAVSKAIGGVLFVDEAYSLKKVTARGCKPGEGSSDEWRCEWQPIEVRFEMMLSAG